MKHFVRSSIHVLLVFASGAILSCKTDPGAKLIDDSFSAMADYDAEVLGKTLGIGGSTPELEALLAGVKKTFGDIRPKKPWDKDKDFLGGYTLGEITLAGGNPDRGRGMPFIGSTGKEGSMMFDFAGAGTSPCSFSVTVQIEATRPAP